MARISVKNTFLSLSFAEDDAEESSNEDGRQCRREGDSSNRARSADCISPNRQSRWPEVVEQEEEVDEEQNGTTQIEKLNKLFDTPEQSTEPSDLEDLLDLPNALDAETLESPQLSPQLESREVTQSQGTVADMYAAFMPMPGELGGMAVSHANFGFNSGAVAFHPWQPIAGDWSGADQLSPNSWAVRSRKSASQRRQLATPSSPVPRVDSSPSMSNEETEEMAVNEEQRTRSNCSVSTMASDHAEDQDDHGNMADIDLTRKQGAKPRSWNGPMPVGPVSPNRQAMQRASWSPSKPGPLPKEYRHGHVPKNLNLEEEYKHAHHNMPPTTLMIRNIPNRYTQKELIAELDDLGFGGTFNFLYLPLDKGTMANVGYAFVNFLEHTWAERCMASFQGYCFRRHRRHSRKVAAVSVAHIQGLEANLMHYETAAVNTAKLKQRRPLVVAGMHHQYNRGAVAAGAGQLPPPR